MNRFISFATALATLAGCGTETGNPEYDGPPLTERPADRDVYATARSSRPDSVGVLGHDAELRVDGAWVALGDIRLVQAESCDDGADSEVDIEGPWVADLLGGPPEHLTVPQGLYCRVWVPLDAARSPLPSGAPAQLDGNSVFVEGELADGTPFELRSRREPELDVRSRAEPFELAEGPEALVLAFDLGAWLEGVDLSSGELDGGVLRIDEDHNDDLLEDIEDNIERSLELFEDPSGTGSVPDDATPLASSG